MKFRLFVLISLVLGGMLLFAKKSTASEGTVELVSTTDVDYRCFVASIRMQGGQFRMPFSCRNIEYPVDDNVFYYIMWANPVNGGDPVKLGELNRGKGEFRKNTVFSSLFVTTENKRDVRQPQGEVVMRGDIQPINFLIEAPEPTPTPEETPPEEQPEEEQPQEMSTRDKLFLALRRAGIAALLALVTLVGLVFVITRSRG